MSALVETELDLYKGIDDPRAGGCSRWPEHLHLLVEQTGELFPGRCRATNLCVYCQRLYVVETARMLLADAAEWAPTLWLVLTAREHLTRDVCRRHLRQLWTAARRRWPIEWFCQVEFQKRGALHLNLLVKGVPVSDRQALQQLISDRWCARVDAEPVGQWSGAVRDAEGLTRYLAKTLTHGLKSEQAPPLGWRGHRTSQTRGYLVRPAGVMRAEVRAAEKVKRAIWKAERAGAQRGHEAELTAQLALKQAESWTWRLFHQKPPEHPLTSEERQVPLTHRIPSCEQLDLGVLAERHEETRVPREA